jgi:hypothetical protein
LSVRIRFLWIAFCAVLAAGEAVAQQAGRRRALLVGINDYSASTFRKRPRPTPPPARDWVNLRGAINDVEVLREMLVLLYGFERGDIVTLTNQDATRDAILQTLERHLLTPAAKDDILFFYFAGHGSQVRNTLSGEPDQYDETVVPADSRLGVRDIRDKELRVLFNRILDRGARLTVLLDSCHSGSGARGLPTGARPRGIDPDRRDIADGTIAGPPPEDRGALILSAAQDFDKAWEARDGQGKMHGVFSWAWIRSMRDSSAGESAVETFLRAAARMRAETPFQEPVLAGRQAQLSPFLSSRNDRRGERNVVGVVQVRADGSVILQGGWANGLSVGTELRVLGERETRPRLTITAIHGLGQSEARMQGPATVPPSVRTGALLEVTGWAAPPDRPLRVWTPRVPGNVGAIRSLARRLSDVAAQRGVRWLNDPSEVTATHLLRRGTRDWELLGPGGALEHLGPESSDAIAGVSGIRAGSSLFVQLPAPAALIDGIDVGPGTDREGIVPVQRPEEADYILVGRHSSRRLAYAWMRPLVHHDDRRETGLPVRTTWIAEDGRDETLRDSAPALREAVLRLRRIQAWLLLESPPEGRWSYRLGLKRERNGEWAAERVMGEEKYNVWLRAPSKPAYAAPRYVYVFVLDRYGKSVLLFPRNGSVENRFPLAPPASAEIALGTSAAFEVAPPYGVDTYFLLSTDEPLPDPYVLEWSGVRTRAPQGHSPLEELLLLTGTTGRGPRRATPFSWSIERLVLESVQPRAASKTTR